MSFSVLLLLIIAFSLCSFFFSSSSAFKKIKDSTTKPSALPKHYGQYSFVWTLFPAFLLLLVFTIIGPIYIDHFFKQQIAISDSNLNEAKIELILAKIKNIAFGAISGDEIAVIKLSEEYNKTLSKLNLFRTLAVLLLSSIMGIIISTNINV